MSRRVAIIVAMEREISPLLSKWRRAGKKVEPWSGLRLLAFESAYECEGVLALCGGMGRRPAAMAARAAIDHFEPDILISGGLAGALDSKIPVGRVLRPTQVVDAATGEKHETVRNAAARGVLVTASSVLSREEKEEMARKFGAEAVDMEAAVVAEIARAAGVPFVVVKAISDPLDFAMPSIDQFIDARGRLHLLKLIGYAALRPQTWKSLNELRRNSQIASEALAVGLDESLLA